MKKFVYYLNGKRHVEVNVVATFEDLPAPATCAGQSINVAGNHAHGTVDKHGDLPDANDCPGISYNVLTPNMFGLLAGVYRSEGGTEQEDGTITGAKWVQKKTKAEVDEYPSGLYQSDGEGWTYVCSLDEASTL